MPHLQRSDPLSILEYQSRHRGVLAPPAASRIIHVASTGTKVVDSRYEEIIANPTAKDSGTNNCLPTPTIKNEGTKTERTQSIASNRGSAVFRHASTTAWARDIPDSRAESSSEWI